MADLVLESAERSITDDLLKIVGIFDIYLQSFNTFYEMFKATFAVTRIRTPKGDLREFPTRQVVKMAQVFLIPLSDDLLGAIRGLKGSNNSFVSDLFFRLERLRLDDIQEADYKGLFLLGAKWVEDNYLLVAGNAPHE